MKLLHLLSTDDSVVLLVASHDQMIHLMVVNKV